jgi:hypothetical protein
MHIATRSRLQALNDDTSNLWTSHTDLASPLFAEIFTCERVQHV